VSRQAAVCVGSRGTVWAIEPDPRTFPKLAGLVAECPQVRVTHAAVTDKVGESLIYLSYGSPQTSLREANTERPQSLTVPTVTLDMLIPDHVIVHAVKIDVQGGECEVLRGADRLLRTCPAWITEVDPAMLAEFGHTREELRDIMESYGFEPWIYPPKTGPHRVTDDEWASIGGPGRVFSNISWHKRGE